MNDEEFDQMLEKYAGDNSPRWIEFAKGADIMVQANIDDAPFIHKVTEFAVQSRRPLCRCIVE